MTYDSCLEAGLHGSWEFFHILNILTKFYFYFFVNVLASLINTDQSAVIPFLTILQYCLD